MPRKRGSSTKTAQATANVTKSVETKRRLEELLEDQLLEILEGDPTLLTKLPESTLATLLERRLPKAQPVSEVLEQRRLSLANMLATLPDHTDNPTAQGLDWVLKEKMRDEIKALKARIKVYAGEDEDIENMEAALSSALEAQAQWFRNAAQMAAAYSMPPESLRKRVRERMKEFRPKAKKLRKARIARMMDESVRTEEVSFDDVAPCAPTETPEGMEDVL